MLPDDIPDSFIMIVLLIILIVGGVIFQFSNLAAGKNKFIYVGDELEIRDEEELFFLNLLRTEVDGKTVADLIILSEDNDELIGVLEDEIEKIMDFYGKHYYEYSLKIDYPSEEIEDKQLGCQFEIEDAKIKQNLPSLNNGLIELQFTFQGGECYYARYYENE